MTAASWRWNFLGKLCEDINVHDLTSGWLCRSVILAMPVLEIAGAAASVYACIEVAVTAIEEGFAHIERARNRSKPDGPIAKFRGCAASIHLVAYSVHVVQLQCLLQRNC